MPDFEYTARVMIEVSFDVTADSREEADAAVESAAEPTHYANDMIGWSGIPAEITGWRVENSFVEGYDGTEYGEASEEE